MDLKHLWMHKTMYNPIIPSNIFKIETKNIKSIFFPFKNVLVYRLSLELKLSSIQQILKVKNYVNRKWTLF